MKKNKEIKLPRIGNKEINLGNEYKIPEEALNMFRQTNQNIENLKSKLQSDLNLVAIGMNLPKKIKVDLNKGLFIEIL